MCAGQGAQNELVQNFHRFNGLKHSTELPKTEHVQQKLSTLLQQFAKSHELLKPKSVDRLPYIDGY